MPPCSGPVSQTTHCSWWHTHSAHPARWRWHALVAPQTVEQSAISADQGNTSLPRGGSSLHEGKRRGKGSRRGKGGGDGEGGREKVGDTRREVAGNSPTGVCWINSVPPTNDSHKPLDMMLSEKSCHEGEHLGEDLIHLHH